MFAVLQKWIALCFLSLRLLRIHQGLSEPTLFTHSTAQLSSLIFNKYSQLILKKPLSKEAIHTRIVKKLRAQDGTGRESHFTTNLCPRHCPCCFFRVNCSSLQMSLPSKRKIPQSIFTRKFVMNSLCISLKIPQFFLCKNQVKQLRNGKR